MNISKRGIVHEMRMAANMIENNCEPTIGAKTAKQTREVERSLRAAELRKFADRIEEAERPECPCLCAFRNMIAVLEKWSKQDLPPMLFESTDLVIRPKAESCWLTLLRQVQYDCKTALEAFGHGKE